MRIRVNEASLPDRSTMHCVLCNVIIVPAITNHLSKRQQVCSLFTKIKMSVTVSEEVSTLCGGSFPMKFAINHGASRSCSVCNGGKLNTI
jgi:hypothetical protein